jgi:predicted outer membrane repeat protein
VDFETNSSAGDGGGLSGYHDSPSFYDVTFTSNNAAGDGGALWSQGGLPKMHRVKISYNSAGGNGGGIYWTEIGTNRLFNVNISQNTAAGSGGGAYISGASTRMFNLSFWHNQATTGSGGGFYSAVSDATLTHTTFGGNTAVQGSGIFAQLGTFNLYNSVLWGNTATATAPNQIDLEGEATDVIEYSLVDQPVCPGTCTDHVITGNPQFVDFANGDLRLGLNSRPSMPATIAVSLLIRMTWTKTATSARGSRSPLICALANGILYRLPIQGLAWPR